MEIKLLKDNVLMREEENPFQEIKRQSGLIVMSGLAQSEETGDMQMMSKAIGFAVITNVGPDCKYLKAGDGVYYDRRSIRPVPFHTVYWQINEANIMAYVTDENGSVQDVVDEYNAEIEVENNKTNEAERAHKLGLTLDI